MNEIEKAYHQIDNINYIINKLGCEMWVQVAGQKNIGISKATFWATYIPVNEVDNVRDHSNWDSTIGTQAPCFVESGSETTYYKINPDKVTHENIVHYREFYGIKPNYIEISEEFRLLNNLYHDPESNGLYFIHDNGDVEEVVRYENDDNVYILLKYLVKYASAKQWALLLFFDINVKINGTLKENGLGEFDSETIQSGSVVYGIWGRELPSRSPYCNSILMGKKIIMPKPVDQCGYWPYENDNTYLEFIIGNDESGEPKRYTSNPDLLRNNFGANPQAPHYFTPVFFKKEVMQKYYNHPEIYHVEDGNITCGSLWNLYIDNHLENTISVYLGDLGKNLPSLEQSHWHEYNIPSDQNISFVKYKRDFLGIFADPEISDLKFRNRYSLFQDKWHEKFGWYLLVPLSENDIHNLSAIHLPIINTQEEFDSFILALVKTIIDSINEKEIVNQLINPSDLKGGISKLERWFKELELLDYEIHIKFLRELQELRSSGSGHIKGKNYSKISKSFGLKNGNFLTVSNTILLRAIEYIDYTDKSCL